MGFLSHPIIVKHTAQQINLRQSRPSLRGLRDEGFIILQNSFRDHNDVLLDIIPPIIHIAIQNHWKLHQLWSRLARDYILLTIVMHYSRLWSHGLMLQVLRLFTKDTQVRHTRNHISNWKALFSCHRSFWSCFINLL